MTDGQPETQPTSDPPAPPATPYATCDDILSALHGRFDKLESGLGSTFRDVVSYVQRAIGEVGVALLGEIAKLAGRNPSPAPTAAVATPSQLTLGATGGGACPTHPEATVTANGCTATGCTWAP